MKMRTKIIIAVLLVGAAIALTVTGCSNQNGNVTEHNDQLAGTNLLVNNQPPPIFGTSAIRQEVIEIEAIEALGSPTTTFFYPPGASPATGAKPFKSCPSEGEPIPNTTSLTNPTQVAPGHDVPIDQMDPNGIYTPTASSGTFVLCLTPGGGTKLTYWEGDVFAESGAAVYDAATAQIVDVGPSQLPVCTLNTSNGSDGTGLQDGTRYYHCVKA